MATVKVTVTIQREQAEAIRELVNQGQADSVSGFVQHAIGVALDDVAGWQLTLQEALAASGGALSADERRWADDVLRSATLPAA